MAGVEAVRRPPRQPARRRCRLLRLLLRLPGRAAGLHRSSASSCATSPSCSTDAKDAINDLLPGLRQDAATSPTASSTSTRPTRAALSITGIVGGRSAWCSPAPAGCRRLRDGIRAIFGVEGDAGQHRRRQAARPRRPRPARRRRSCCRPVVGGDRRGRRAVGRRRWSASESQAWVAHAWSRFVVGVAPRRRARRADAAGPHRASTCPWRGAAQRRRSSAGSALTVLKKFGALLLASTTDNPLFLTFALVVGLLVWLNFMSRIILISAAWAANDLDTARS